MRRKCGSSGNPDVIHAKPPPGFQVKAELLFDSHLVGMYRSGNRGAVKVPQVTALLKAVFSEALKCQVQRIGNTYVLNITPVIVHKGKLEPV